MYLSISCGTQLDIGILAYKTEATQYARGVHLTLQILGVARNRQLSRTRHLARERVRINVYIHNGAVADVDSDPVA